MRSVRTILAVGAVIIAAAAHGTEILPGIDPVQEVKNYDPAIPNPTNILPFGVPWCASTTLIIAAIRNEMAHKGPLKNSHAYQIVGGCVVPLIGTKIVKHFTDEHPEWDALKFPVVKRGD